MRRIDLLITAIYFLYVGLRILAEIIPYKY